MIKSKIVCIALYKSRKESRDRLHGKRHSRTTWRKISANNNEIDRLIASIENLRGGKHE